MPDWKDELKTEITDIQASLQPELPPHFVHIEADIKAKAIMELCALILELIDHIPEEQEPK